MIFEIINDFGTAVVSTSDLATDKLQSWIIWIMAGITGEEATYHNTVLPHPAKIPISKRKARSGETHRFR
jgi:hypothetical protein